MKKMQSRALVILIMVSLLSCINEAPQETNVLPVLRVSENNRYLVDENGDPFFWLGDTGWLLFSKLTREEAEVYLNDRVDKGYNVIQVMVLHSLDVINAYGDSALIGENVSTPLVTEGNNYEDTLQYDFWDHVDYVVDLAAEKGLYIGLVPIWGTNVKKGGVSRKEAAIYAEWLANRYKNRSNIIWLNGGDINGSDSIDIWKDMGRIINKVDTTNLITFHPRGRTTSSTWFHNEDWLDFNMFQSGHRRYDQDDTEWAYGEDNWRFVNHDYALTPVRPTIDGEPSYEGIPQGLHDPTQPYWEDKDLRRYAYWSVFAGGFGFTYGANSVMQFHKPGDINPSFGVREYWDEGIELPGSGQMQFLKKLILSRPYLERFPDQSLIAGENGVKYDYLVATRGEGYAFIYTYTGRNIPVQMGKISGNTLKANWFKPCDGTVIYVGEFENAGTFTFEPPGEKVDGNDWVLILDDSSKQFCQL